MDYEFEKNLKEDAGIGVLIWIIIFSIIITVASISAGEYLMKQDIGPTTTVKVVDEEDLCYLETIQLGDAIVNNTAGIVNYELVTTTDGIDVYTSNCK